MPFRQIFGNYITAQGFITQIFNHVAQKIMYQYHTTQKNINGLKIFTRCLAVLPLKHSNFSYVNFINARYNPKTQTK
jgi:hypothetical protein